jgi:hypothetical protein
MGSVPMPIQVGNIPAMAASSPLSRQSSLNNPNNNPNFIPPMVPTSHRSSPASVQQPQQQQQQQEPQQQQQQQQQQYAGAMTPTAQHGSVGRVPAPLPKAR